ncbi:MAG: PhnB protein [Mucilaginibacter sp.]|nr:PhnB protein [Mucilaginibacter sp.]
MTQINAYINFNGKCREAMTFYQECLGGNLVLQPIEGSPIESQCPASMKTHIMHSSLTKDSLILMASDMTGPGGYIYGNSIVLSLNCSSEEEINTFYSKLSEGGEIVDPLKVQFWGALFGVFDDKFGIRWMLIHDKNQN